jgi:hypothetical protein
MLVIDQSRSEIVLRLVMQGEKLMQERRRSAKSPTSPILNLGSYVLCSSLLGTYV